MAALISCVLYLVRTSCKRLFPACTNRFLVDRGPYGLPVPVVKHRVITEEELAGKRLVIIGDVHGCYDELNELLDKCDARHGNSVVVFVGDLINKGPNSTAIVKLGRSLSAFAVRGNHEEVVLREWFSHQEGHQLHEEFQWLKEFSQDDLNWISDLPYTLTIPSFNIIVVHAGLVPGIALEQQDLYNLIHMRNLTFDKEKGVWVGTSKALQGSKPWASVWQGPEHVYFGHDAIRLLQDYEFATGLDTGCVYGGSLTAAVLDGKNRRIVQVKCHAVYQNPQSRS